MNYIMEIFIFSFIFIILASSFNLLLGLGGLFSIAHSIFYGLGAYFSALLVAHTEMPVLLAMLLSMILTGIFSLLLAIPTLRVSGDYLAIASLGFSIVLIDMLSNFEFTGGSAGLTGIKKIEIFGWGFTESWMFAVFTGVIAALVLALINWIAKSPFGRLLRGIREDETATMGLGKNVFLIRISVFVMASALAGLAGGLYAHYFRFLSPDGFGLSNTITIICMVVIGGIGTLWGPVIGAFILMGLPELLRFLTLPPNIIGPLQQILFVVIVLLFIYLRPNGIIGVKSKFKESGEQTKLESTEEGVVIR